MNTMHRCHMIFETKFGSQIYGTNSPDSDTDIKGVFMPWIEDRILGKHKEHIIERTNPTQTKNTKEDVDRELKDIQRFLYDCMKGQTYALDMLFTPKKFWITWSPTWNDIIANREKLLSRNVQPYIGYCRQQAGKYGLKGSRLGELIRVIDILKKYDSKSLLGDVPEIPATEFVYYENLVTRNDGTTTSPFLTVLGKHFQLTKQISQVLFSLEKMNAEYGHRAKLAQENEGIDWKAISHAFRCCYQLIELAETKKIKFPLKEAQKLKDIKYGKYKYVDIQDEIAELMDKAIKAVESSSLPLEPDYKFWDEFIINLYLENL